LLHSLRIDEVVNVVAPPLALHQPDALEHPQVLGNGRLAYPQERGYGVDAKSLRETLAAEQFYQLKPGGIRQRSEQSSLFVRPLL